MKNWCLRGGLQFRTRYSLEDWKLHKEKSFKLRKAILNSFMFNDQGLIKIYGN